MDDTTPDMKRLNLVTLPIRTAVLLFLLAAAYYYGYGTLHEEWRKESPQSGIVVRYTRNDRPWRIFYDRDRNGKWDMWIDERVGYPFIVSIDDNGDGKPDREEDEWGIPLPAHIVSRLRAYKTYVEFLHNPRQLTYSGLALIFFSLLEFAVRLFAKR